MSDASLRRDWRLWEGGRDEDALRRYVVAVCREAPGTPLEFRMVKTRKNGRWRASIEESHYEAEHDIERLQFAAWSVMPIQRRTVAAPIRRLTVCGPWLPGGIRGWVYRLGWRGMNLPYDERWIDRSEETTLLPVISNP